MQFEISNHLEKGNMQVNMSVDTELSHCNSHINNEVEDVGRLCV